MRWLPLWLVCVTLVLSLASVSHAQAGGAREFVDGVAAVVGASGAGPDVDVILHSDVELRARILLGGERGRVETGPISGYWLAQALEQMIGESLIAREAERVRVVTPTSIDQQSERRHLEMLAGGASQLAALVSALGVSSAEIERMVRRRALVAVFLTANLDRVMVVTEAEIERAYEASRSRWGDRSLESVREMLRAQLAREAMRNTVAQWVTTLRARTTVRVVADYLGQAL